MAGLTGTRLRLYDEAEACGRADPRTEEERAAAEWLVEHRLGRYSELDGYLENVPIGLARRQWEALGPSERRAAEPPAMPKTPAETGASHTTFAQRTGTGPVHAHQPELFSDERL